MLSEAELILAAIKVGLKLTLERIKNNEGVTCSLSGVRKSFMQAGQRNPSDSVGASSSVSTCRVTLAGDDSSSA